MFVEDYEIYDRVFEDEKQTAAFRGFICDEGETGGCETIQEVEKELLNQMDDMIERGHIVDFVDEYDEVSFFSEEDNIHAISLESEIIGNLTPYRKLIANLESLARRGDFDSIEKLLLTQENQVIS